MHRSCQPVWQLANVHPRLPFLGVMALPARAHPAQSVVSLSLDRVQTKNEQETRRMVDCHSTSVPVSCRQGECDSNIQNFFTPREI